MSALDDMAAAKNATENPQRTESLDRIGQPAAWKAFGEPATTSAPVFGTGAPYLPISSTRGGIQ